MCLHGGWEESIGDNSGGRKPRHGGGGGIWMAQRVRFGQLIDRCWVHVFPVLTIGGGGGGETVTFIRRILSNMVYIRPI